jgi:methylase of polypeptide subunit release factors
VSTPREESALIELGAVLRAAGYQFVTPTPETQRRVNERALRQGADRARDLRDVFGWSRPFAPALLPQRWLGLLEAAGELEPAAGLLRARVRFSSLDELLLVHSAFPTHAADAVFLGPDTYRFCALLRHWAPAARRVVDLGCGSGAGGLCLRARVRAITLADVNQRALRYSRVNAALAGVEAEVVESDVLSGVVGDADLIIANPPYMLDAAGRTYRDGGGALGEGLSVRMTRDALARLRDGGTLIVYTGSAIVAGRDSFHDAVTPLLSAAGLDYTYRELDPDVFGEELASPGYDAVERIAVVGLCVRCGGEVAGPKQR